MTEAKLTSTFRARARKATTIVAWFGAGVTLLLFVLAGALRLAVVRNFAVARVNYALQGALRGKIRIDRVARLGLSGVAGVDATVFDPSGRTVIIVRGACARITVVPLVWAALVHPRASLPINISDVTALHVEVRFIDDGFGIPTLADAFAPPHPNVTASQSALPTLHLTSIEIHHAWAHGRLSTAPAIDAEATRISANLELVSDRLRLQVNHADVTSRGLPNQIDPQGTISGFMALSVTAPSRVGKGTDSNSYKPIVQAWYSGKFAGSDVTAAFDWADDRVSASLEALRIESASLARVWPGARLAHPLTLKATAEGTLSDVRFDVQTSMAKEWSWFSNSTVAPATLVVKGQVTLSGDPELAAEFRADNVNLAALFGDAPESRVRATGHVRLKQTYTASTSGSYDIVASPGYFSGIPTPALSIGGDFSRPVSGMAKTKGQAQILEPGARTAIAYSVTLSPKPSESVVTIESSTEVTNPPRLALLAGGVTVRGFVHASARYWLTDGHWVTQSHAQFHDVRRGIFSAAAIDVRAKAAGGRRTPSGEVQIHASDIRAAEQSFRYLDVAAEGNLGQARLRAHFERDGRRQFEVTSELGIDPILRAQHIQLNIPSSDGTVTISVDEVRSSKGLTTIDGLRVQGAGKAEGSLSFGKELQQLALTTDSFDVARVARVLGLTVPIEAGRATLVARYDRREGAAKGFAVGRVTQLRIGPIHDASIDANLTLARDTIEGTVTTRLAKGSLVTFSANAVPLSILEYPERALELHDLSVSAKGAVNIGEIRLLTRALGLPLDHASGVIQFDLTASGPTREREYPEILARVETHSLELAGNRDGQDPIKDTVAARSSQPWTLRGIDGKFDISISGTRPHAEVSTRLFDKNGTLVDAHFTAALPESCWHSFRLEPRELWQVPLALKLHVPRRSLQNLPPMLGAQGLRGIATLDAALDGTLRDPKIVIDGAIQRFASVTNRPAGRAKPKLNVSVHAVSSRHAGHTRFDAKVRGALAASVEANWVGDIVDLESANLEAPSPIQGSLIARFRRLPLEAIPAVRNVQFSGLLSGDISLSDWGKDARLATGLEVSQLGLGTTIIARTKFTLDGANGRLLGGVALSGKDSGMLEVDAQTAMKWGDQLLPNLDPRVRGTLRAKGFQLTMLTPFLSGSVNELAGSIDAKLDAVLVDGIPNVEGRASISQGVIQVPSIGQRFASIVAQATIHNGEIRVEGIQARGLTGRATGSARAQLKGLSLATAEAHLAIAKGEPIPITVEGQAVGDAWGHVDVTLVRSAETKATKVVVSLPEAHLELPELDPTDLQGLDPDEHVRIGALRGDGRFVSLPVQPISREAQGSGEAILIEVHLGNSVWVQKGKEIKVHLAGDLLARVANKTTLEGRVELKGGMLDVSGKKFEIESGVVTFDGGDPGNPLIVATARWDSPTEYRVYANYAGTVKEGKLTLRSDPPLSADKVLSLLMFGSVEGSFASAGTQSRTGESSAAAAGIAGDTAVKGLNRAISGITQLDVSARLDTSTGTARPELDVQLSRRITARMTRAIGEPTAGQSPDRTFLTLEWRILRAWSLSAVVGDHGGSGLDLVWRRRY